MRHNQCTAVRPAYPDDINSDENIWRCEICGKEGTWKWLHEQPCLPYKSPAKQNVHLEVHFNGMTDDESVDYQVLQWLQGNPIHNPIRDECCPDFSCCVPSMLSTREERERFVLHMYQDDRLETQQFGIDKLKEVVNKELPGVELHVVKG